MIVKKAIIVNVKLSPVKLSEIKAVSEKKLTATSNGDETMPDFKKLPAASRENLEQILKAEEQSQKLEIKIAGFSQAKDGSLKLKLKITGQAEIAEDFAALTEKAVTDIFTKQAEKLKPFELAGVGSNG